MKELMEENAQLRKEVEESNQRLFLCQKELAEKVQELEELETED